MAAVIYQEARECDRRLSQYFNSNQSQWIDIVKAMVAARGSCTAHNPKASAGYFAWDAGITRMRQMFCREGWNASDESGVELITNHDFRRKVTVMNADKGVCDPLRSPRNRTEKGPMAEKITDLNNQLDLFRQDHPREIRRDIYDLWQLCVFDDGKDVRAELSRPIEFRGGFYVGYSERIWIIRPGEWERIAVENPADEDGQDFDITVRRK
ncbi:hypothetical protein [Rhizobium leguminosarum]|uniref:hypothetical protein n=1 Tax=Rhizobium leguminosarum TaxID=384 RepID=UPI0021BBED04|nr:hypothetical protein [Rhizobium leguminosarum]